MSTEVFEAKSRAELVKLAQQSVAWESGGLHQKNLNACQEGTSKASATRKLSIMLDYVLDLSDYILDLSDYTGMSNVLSSKCIV